MDKLIAEFEITDAGVAKRISDFYNLKPVNYENKAF